ncbi:glycerol operon regulatory protein [Streptomyces tanashiensis]|jgi:DNA-binding IclR family transcriptional regulator|uniref:IclR family transcriptional regulator n=1 Tax=Streptomyces tanashiensis TaxID=67367 RepID=A0ABY6QRT6_9ACTN|nr:IclR family transcriptional regulator [Streptomyces tanashiensis]UZX20488.1 IclR family transcriptional regulator [Streptomyces tanashiensis]GGT01689.1 glycerol operon regulatory protein [Streptomyces tanashiensis]GGY46794.1 glycerol operon regulatory protein [Streptomyces tanashiensis]
MVQSVQRAARILRELSTRGPRLGVTELAERIGVSKPTVHALLQTLESEGLVRQEKGTSKYLLGMALLSMGNAYLETQELRSHSVAWANTLAERTGEAVWVAVLDDAGHILVVHHAFRPQSGVQIPDLGASVPWNTSALGKALVSFLPQQRQKALLEGGLARLTGNSVVDPALLAGQLEGARQTGYALEDQESTLGEASIASPVFDRSGDAAGAIGIIGPVERLLSEPDRQRHAVAVRDVATLLSRELGAGRGVAWRVTD